jgi:B12-binding domain/radical SAM domain protein
VVGEGEVTFPALLGALDEGRDFRSIDGIAFLDGAECRFTPARPPIDLDLFPPFSIRHDRFNALELTRGCPFSCGFCQTSQLFGRRPRHRSIPNVVENARAMIERNLRYIRFVTPNSFAYGSSEGDLRELLVSLRSIARPESKIFLGSFPSEVRPECVTESAVRLVAEFADNDNIVIGAQSGSQRMLDLCGRRHGVQEIRDAVDITVRAGFKAYVDFVFGLPGETAGDSKATLALIDDLVLAGARVHAHVFLPLPQTRFAGRRAEPLDGEVKGVIERMISQGTLFGNWREQEELSRRLSERMESGR